MTFSLFDVFFVILVLIVALTATAKGFVKELFNKASWILSLLCGFFFYSKLDFYISKTIPYAWVSKLVSFLLIFIVVFLIVKILQTVIAKVFEGEIMRGLDRSLGFLLGLAEGLGFSFIIVFLIYIQPWFPTQALFEGSFFYSIFQNFLPVVSEKIISGSAI